MKLTSLESRCVSVIAWVIRCSIDFFKVMQTKNKKKKKNVRHERSKYIVLYFTFPCECIVEKVLCGIWHEHDCMTAWHIRIHVVCERIDVTVYDVHEEWLKKRWCALHFSIFGWKMTIYIPTSGQRHFYYSCTHVIISSGVAITCLDTFFFFYVELIFAKLNKFCSSSNEFDFSDEIYVGEHLQCRTQCRRTQ